MHGKQGIPTLKAVETVLRCERHAREYHHQSPFVRARPILRILRIMGPIIFYNSGILSLRSDISSCSCALDVFCNRWPFLLVHGRYTARGRSSTLRMKYDDDGSEVGRKSIWKPPIRNLSG